MAFTLKVRLYLRLPADGPPRGPIMDAGTVIMVPPGPGTVTIAGFPASSLTGLSTHVRESDIKNKLIWEGPRAKFREMAVPGAGFRLKHPKAGSDKSVPPVQADGFDGAIRPGRSVSRESPFRSRPVVML